MSFNCSFKDCSSGKIDINDGRVEIRATLPKKKSKDFKTFKLQWQENGDALLHHSCWEKIIKAYRARSKKSVAFVMSTKEKALVREAIKTAEFHDSDEQLEEEAKRITKMIRKAEHCVVFSGAGISTSAGIGDYRGKSGKWTEEER
jgi:mono-ADP-ribosyltransferase sirtuin 6